MPSTQKTIQDVYEDAHKRSDGLGDTDINQKYAEQIREARLFDDVMMTLAFDKNVECVQLMLRIILGRDDIIVREVRTQSPQPVFTGHSVIFDIDAVGADNVPFDIELQNADKGADVKRARYHSSVLDTHQLPKGDDYSTLKECYVIFITKNDVMGAGLPIYHGERMIVELDKPMGDGSHIIYVNGAYEDTDTAIGKLMHDLMCKQPDEMYYDVLAERARYFKETDKGGSEMNESLERLINSEKEIQKKEIIKKLIMKGNDSFEEIAECVGVSEEAVRQIADEMSVPV